MNKIEHLADFLGSEKRRRWAEFHDTRLMNCWDCINVIDELADAYGLHWNKESMEFREEILVESEQREELEQ